MTRSIVLGGIVGIAIGAIITFAIAHGVFELRAARAETSPITPRMLPAADQLEEERSIRVTHRPQRPGSAPRGPGETAASRT